MATQGSQCTGSAQQQSFSTSPASNANSPSATGDATAPPPGLFGNGNGTSSQAGEEISETIPAETTGETQVLAEGEQASTLSLERGQYRVQFTVPANVDATGIKGQTKRVPIDGEMKRVHFYKVDAVPTDETSDDGEPLVKVTAVFRVLDNPLPLAPIAWGAAALVGAGGGGWLLFDSAESFVEDTTWPILTGAAAILSVMVAWHTLFGS